MHCISVAFSLEPEANEDNSYIQNEDESVEIDHPDESHNQAMMGTDNSPHTLLVQSAQSTLSSSQSTSERVGDWVVSQNTTDDYDTEIHNGENRDGIDSIIEAVIPEDRRNPLKRKHVDTSTTADDLGEIGKPLEKTNVSDKNKSSVSLSSSELQRGQMKLGHTSTEKAKGKVQEEMEVDTSQQKRIRK